MSNICNYDFVAPYYDGLSQLVFSGQLVAAKNYFLPQLQNPENLLIFGGGTGKLIKPLLTLYPETSIHFVEASRKMIAKARASLPPGTDNVRFQLGTEAGLTSGSYDTVITPFVLDVFDQPRLNQVIAALFRSLKPEGRWIHTDFYLDEQSAFWQKSLIWIMYKFFRVTAGQMNQTLPDFTGLFAQLPMEPLGIKTFCNRMVRSTLFQKSSGSGSKPLEKTNQDQP
ncbi:MAG: hypothetical protein DHS20C17_00580 [Cyclobacteriaceae bacterium]|nr:MAG: hypothetical protein DHS20C17_00580 [Cyclobacteriaceae bacterium]